MKDWGKYLALGIGAFLVYKMLVKGSPVNAAASVSGATGAGGQVIAVSQWTNDILVKYPDGSEYWMKSSPEEVAMMLKAHPEFLAIS